MTTRPIIFKNPSKRHLKIRIKLGSYFRKFHSLNKLDENLSNLLPHRNGYYVEIGANDGISQSNTLYFERKKNWSGILVEPDKHNFRILTKNRSKSNKFFNCGCVSFEFKESFIEFIYSNLMSVTVNDESDFDKFNTHALSGIRFLAKDEIIETYLVPAMNLESILDQASAPYLMDFFSLDVEGNELEVLKGLNHNKYRFKYILVETNEIATISSFLNDAKYHLMEKLSHHDYLFKNAVV
jgi:FkbM family methyltransferase